MSQFDLTGKVAIVTGSSRGIGRASAFELAEHGAKVVISSRKQDACDEVAAELNGKYGEGTAIVDFMMPMHAVQVSERLNGKE